jgi:hypothetical protein
MPLNKQTRIILIVAGLLILVGLGIGLPVGLGLLKSDEGEQTTEQTNTFGPIDTDTTSEGDEIEENLPDSFEILSITNDSGTSKSGAYVGTYTRVDPPTISSALVQWANDTDDEYNIIYNTSANKIYFRTLSETINIHSSEDDTYSMNPLLYEGDWLHQDSVRLIEFTDTG